MNVVARFRRTLAVLLVALMLGPIIPMAEADHVSSQRPGTQQLPRAHPTDECVGLQVPAQVVARFVDANGAPRDGPYLAENEGVPSVCDTTGRPSSDYQGLVRQLDEILGEFRNVSNELQRQFDQRLDYTYPEGPCPRGDAPGATTNGLTCPITRPQYTIIEDHFDGRRLGGFGEWTVVTDGKTPPQFHADRTSTPNGTLDTWRFGDESGYLRGAHEYLVSPELDLTAVRGDPTLISRFVFAYGEASKAVQYACGPFGGNVPAPNPLFLFVCGPDTELGRDLRAMYQSALASYAQSLPIGQAAATLELTYRHNLANGEDGVRVWAYVGDKAPTRVELFNKDFAREKDVLGCIPPRDTYETVQGLNSGNRRQVDDQVCTPRPGTGGARLLFELGDPGVARTAAFTDPDRVPRSDEPHALTGYLGSFRTLSIPLNDFIGTRVWIVVEVATQPDYGRGGQYFDDKARFPIQRDYGFELASIKAMGDAWPRNMRIKDVGATYELMPADNQFKDVRNATRTIQPPTDGAQAELVVARIHNAGTYEENVTVTLESKERTGATGFAAMPRIEPVLVKGIRPGEVREVKFAWPKDPVEGRLYLLAANLSAQANTNIPLSNPRAAAEPNVTAVRIPNQAANGIGGYTNATQLVRAFTDTTLTAVRVSPGAGQPIEICSTYSATRGCDPASSADKGTRRLVVLGIRNDGNAPQDLSAVLSLQLDGIERATAVLDEPRIEILRLLPGETRTLQWAIAPADPGAYVATVSFLLPDGLPARDSVSRLVYVQRSTGLVCFDDLAEKRECGPSFQVVPPREIQGQDITAAVLDANGVLHVATAITAKTGALYRLDDDAWVKLADLDSERLEASFGRPRADMGYGAIRDLAFAPDGRLWMAGDNMTILEWRAGDSPRAHPYWQPEAGNVTARVGSDVYRGHVGAALPLAGGRVEGIAPFTFEWRVNVTPPGSAVPLALSNDGHTTITPDVAGIYQLALRVTDGRENDSWAETLVIASAAPPACIVDAGEVWNASLVARGGPTPGLRPIEDISCVRLWSSPYVDNTNPAFSLGDFIAHIDLVDADVDAQDTKYNVTLDFSFGTTRHRLRTVVENGNINATHNAWVTVDNAGAETARSNLVNARLQDDAVRFVAKRGAFDALTRGSTTVDAPLTNVIANVSIRETGVVLDTLTQENAWRFDLPAPPARLDNVDVVVSRKSPMVQLSWAPAVNATKYFVERAHDANGPWVVIARPASAFFVDQDATPYVTYHYRVTPATAAESLGVPSRPVLATPLAARVDLEAVAWHNNTAWAAGTMGGLFWRNATAERFDEHNLTFKPVVGPDVVYGGDIHALHVDGKRLHLAGDLGMAFVHEGYHHDLTKAWNRSATGVGNVALRTFVEFDGELWLAGDDGTLLRALDAHNFTTKRASGLPATFDASESFVTRSGQLALASAEGGFRICLDCSAGVAWSLATAVPPTWIEPSAAIPTLARDGKAQRARVLDAVSASHIVRVVGEGGLILDHADRDKELNALDWDTTPALVATGGGVLQTDLASFDRDVGWRWAADSTKNVQDLTGWSELRVNVRHHLAYLAPISSANEYPEVRILYFPVPNARTNVGETLTCAPHDQPGSQDVGNGVTSICSSLTLLLDNKEIKSATQVPGWETLSYRVPPPRFETVQGTPMFHAIEFFKPSQSRWAIDAFTVEGYFPQTGTWRTLVAWDGPKSPNNVGQESRSPNDPFAGQWAFAKEPLGTEPVSAWHLSVDLADRPVWVANDEVLPGFQSGSKARLRDNWDTRLVTPVIDLSDAIDPVVLFRHLYSLRTLVTTDILQGDAAWVEVQYELRGKECGSDDPDATCWSQFHRVCPERPGATPITTGGVKPVTICPEGTGYPSAEEIGYPAGSAWNTNRGLVGTDIRKVPNGPSVAGGKLAADTSAYSFWGASTRPNADRVIADARHTETYDTVELHLNKQEVRDAAGDRVKFDGKRIRMAFHLMTVVVPPKYDLATDTETAAPAPQFNPANPNQETNPSTFIGEGWYITDLRVRGAPQLGMDVAATNMTFGVGYDSARIGVGPGTRVPLNVTVENRGQYDVPGYGGTLTVRRVLDAVNGLTETVAHVVLPQQPRLDKAESRNHTMFWDVPTIEGAQYALEFVATVVDISDEDPTDNVARLGTLSRPILAKTMRDYRVELLVSPENATTEITRFVPLYINNTGNVPLDGIRIVRSVTEIGASAGAADIDADCKLSPSEVTRLRVEQPSIRELDCFLTTRAAPPGTLVALTTISDNVDVGTDLFWKAPRRSNYIFQVAATVAGNTTSATADETLVRNNERRVSAYATYLFDDSEVGPRGEAVKGEWAFEPGWATAEPGFRSQKAYTFGDPLIVRHPADADVAAVTPILDLTGARSAQLAVYHRYKFEDGFDGGVVEGSLDGVEWSRLAPLKDKLNLKQLPHGYSGTIAASSPLHRTQDPRVVERVFTGESSALDHAVDGWFVSVFDLTQFEAIAESNVPYERYDTSALAGYVGRGQSATPVWPSYDAARPHVYVDGSWQVGPVNEYRYWEVQNLTEGALKPRVGDSFWWSGSMLLTDDGVRPINNTFLKIPIAEALREVRPGESVFVEWWEWVERQGQTLRTVEGVDPSKVASASRPSWDDARGLVTWHSGGEMSHNYRFNVTRPSVIDQDGRWFHLRADVTPWVTANKGQIEDVVFAYTPVAQKYDGTGNSTLYSMENRRQAETKDSRYQAAFLNDRGFIVDGFQVRAATIVGGKVANERILVDEDEAWSDAIVEQCNDSREANVPAGANTLILPCYESKAGGIRLNRAPQTVSEGRAWSLVSDIPGTPGDWEVVTTRINGYDAQQPLPTGVSPKAWHTGTSCADDSGFRNNGLSMKADGRATSGGDRYLVDTTRDFPAMGVKAGDTLIVWDGAGKGSQLRIATVSKDNLTFAPIPDGYVNHTSWYSIPRSHCLRAGEETRLVTPALDLTRVAGQSVELEFLHRYAFQNMQPVGGDDPLASGGVVEISEFDPQTNAWGEWRQIFSEPATVGLVPKFGRTTVMAPGSGYYGGYSGYTVPATQKTDGTYLRHDLPLPLHRTCDKSADCVDRQYLYTGVSTDITPSGWVPAHYDLTDYIGKRVRVGFHVALSGAAHLQHASAKIVDPDSVSGGGGAPSKTGWWITDVGIVGTVLDAHPVQLRFRAATDGNVHDGFWQIDDVGVFGSRYSRNVGVFVEPPAGGFGVTQGNTTVVPIQIRNLGDTARRDLAIDVRRLSGEGFLDGADKRRTTVIDEKRVLLGGYDLAPGETRTVLLNVTAAAVVPAPSQLLLELQLKEFNAGEQLYVNLTDNEVQGFLRREVVVQLEQLPRVHVHTPVLTPAGAKVGETAELRVAVENLGYAPVRLNLTCTHATLLGHDPSDHRKTSTHTNHSTPAQACDERDVSPVLAPRERREIVFEATITHPGVVEFLVNGSFIVGEIEIGLPAVTRFIAPVGVSPVMFHDGFAADPVAPGTTVDPKKDTRANANVQRNWGQNPGSSQGGSSGYWSALRGRDAPGALLLGIDEAATVGDTHDYSAHPQSCGPKCIAYSPPVDLHNYTTDVVVMPDGSKRYTNQSVYLTFAHLSRFAPNDGGRVLAQVLVDETRPTVATSWKDLCLLEPMGGYPGLMRSSPTAPATGDGDGTGGPRPLFDLADGFYPAFTSPKGWDEQWQTARFNLSDASCLVPTNQGAQFRDDEPGSHVSLLGKTVRFLFEAYLGARTGESGSGHGWIIDDVNVGPMGLALSPAVQGATLLDNTTKTFHVVVTNHGHLADLVELRYDAASSSAPADAVVPPTEPVLVMPGATALVPIEVRLPRDPSLLPTEFIARVEARSTLDPAARAVSDIRLKFAPRQWAELALSVTPPRSIVQEGTEVFLPLAIENTGLVASVPSKIVITDRWAGGEVTTTLDLPSMASYFQDPDDSSRVVEFRWKPARGSVGPHTLTVEVDPARLGEEYTRVNNVATLTVPVSELLLPDVDIARADALRLRDAVGVAFAPLREADVTRYEAIAGELVTLEVRVLNSGKAGATNVDVRALVGPLSLPPRTIPYIAPGSEVVLAFNWLAQKGEYPIEIVTRTEQVELSNANNAHPAQGVTLLVVKGFDVTVALPPIDGLLEPGTELRIPFNLTNTGKAGEEIDLRVVTPQGISLELPRDALFLRAGEVYEATATLIVGEHTVAGEQFITIEAVARQNPMKASAAAAPVRVRAFYGGSVEPLMMRAGPPETVVPITLSNEGNSLEPWTLHVALPAGWTSTQALPARVVVPAHGDLTFDLGVRIPAGTPPGPRTLVAKAQLPNGEFREATLTLDVRVVRVAAATIADDMPRIAAGTLSYPVTVENVGNVEAPFQMVLLSQPDGVDARLEPATFTLPPGGKTIATLVVTPVQGAAAGSYALSAYTAFEGVQPDSNEGRSNLQRLQVTLARPDLRVSTLDYAPRADVRAGDRVVVKVPITNDGQTRAENVPVHLYANDQFIAETRLGAIEPGETRQATLNWTALEGEHSLTIVVDPYKEGVDAANEDNAVSALIGVESAPIAGLTGGARVPFPGLAFLLVALALALVVFTDRRSRRPPG